MRVLIADDSAVVRAQLVDVLQEAGFDVLTAKDGDGAWEILRQGQIRLAILDWLMPGKNGPEICQNLQTRQHLQSVYVILLTGKGGSENMAKALASGASDYIVKPFCEAELKARVEVGQRIVQLQMQLSQAQKLESIGQLAAGVAHEINTPIQYVGDNARFLQDAFGDIGKALSNYRQLITACRDKTLDDQQLAAAEAIVEQADLDYLIDEIPTAIEQSLDGVSRVAEIVRAMKDFSHPGVAELTPANIQQAIENTITVARNEWKYVSEIETEFDANLPLVPCFPADLNQMLLNLIVNAAHAIADVVGKTEDEKGTIFISTHLRGEWLEIRIRDTGGGIPEEYQSQIFDPFFTTKEVGKGTGQGLAIVYSVVERHRGSIDFQTESGKGTTFIVRIPIVEDDDSNNEQEGVSNEACEEPFTTQEATV